ncbi:MAG: hypothetical protein LBK98_06385, partial [Peptococcaceae bacterium]|nr:hypothetical protein [Peptococcaceae bacterium]
MSKKYDIVSLFMCALCFFVLMANDFIITLETRIAPMESVSAWSALGGRAWIMLLTLGITTIAIWLKADCPRKNLAAGLLASVFLVEVMFFVGL